MHSCTYGLLCSAIFIVHLETAAQLSEAKTGGEGAEEGNLHKSSNSVASEYLANNLFSNT